MSGSTFFTTSDFRLKDYQSDDKKRMMIKILIINVRNGCFVNSPFPVPKYAFLILILSDVMVNQIILAYLNSHFFIPEHIFDNKGLIENA